MNMSDIVSQTSSNEHEVKLLKIKDVQYRCGISRSMIYVLIKRGDFPKQVHLGPRAVAWNSREIDDWIAQRCNRAS